jgi:hypothetical protein
MVATSCTGAAAPVDTREMGELMQTACDQLHLLEALMGVTVMVPQQAPREADSSFAFFPEPIDFRS